MKPKIYELIRALETVLHYDLDHTLISGNELPSGATILDPKTDDPGCNWANRANLLDAYLAVCFELGREPIGKRP